MSTNTLRKFNPGINLVPHTTTIVANGGDLDSNTTDGKLNYYNGVAGSASPVVTEAHTATLTNKTLSGNTATNLVNGSGTVNVNTSGTVTLPNATDTLVGKATTDTLTNKSISGSTNTITNVSLTTGVTGTLPISSGGTNATTANAGFNNLSPMTTGGDLIYGGASGVATRLANGSSGQVLTSGGGTAAPTWTTNTPGNYTVTSQSTTYSVLTTDQIILVSASSAWTATLPTAVGVTGKVYTFIKTDSNTNVITIGTTSSQTIDGVTTKTIATPHERWVLVSDGSNWQVSDHSYPGTAVSYTPTFAGVGTPTTVAIYSKRAADHLELYGSFSTGTVSATTATITVGFNGTNSNVTVDANKLVTSSVNQLIGYASIGGTTASTYTMLANGGTTGVIYFGILSATANGLQSQAGNNLFGSAQQVSFFAKVPITNWNE